LNVSNPFAYWEMLKKKRPFVSKQSLNLNNRLTSLNFNCKKELSHEEDMKGRVFNKNISTEYLKMERKDVLRVRYESSLQPEKRKLFKVNVGVLVFEEPFIILSMQDVSSES